ncbi:GNAT family N-acetyltransferase [Klebsiella michiganensis]|uniref:GNAT family N-acetyltransferase n=1 Tax=Klebsiella michiganensis TaxID=1134687 RepID=UPI001C809B7E|nr:GNAT family protein [Klebsiella michiganensis]MBX4648094.1 GNAT family N-acetyltransferase [Klebsiella michiganensis]MCZ9452547.1 GNAT family N-acetyltransferase [Klebsiella michiganensis]MDL4398603.1 GNAT family protein [Klebsiella michiganensis]MDL4529664.1 GNAT family protein [Klebsiella michiganensis]UHC88804.1 GNAT family N-acetyltransferase [Klebsiella michiganensis]
MSHLNQFDQPVGAALPDWQPRPHPERLNLQGRLCRLEPLRSTHAGALFDAHRLALDTRSWTWLLREPDNSVEEYRAWIEHVSGQADPIHFAVIDQRTDQPVGSLALMRIDAKNGVVEVGHVHFSPLLSRTAMATEAQWLLMHYIFATLGYRRYEWKCNSLNEPSRRAALRLGFQYEGRFRQALVIKGHNRDTDWFSIIDSEWPHIDKAMQQWLAADNFSADGRQLRTLESFR